MLCLLNTSIYFSLMSPTTWLNRNFNAISYCLFVFECVIPLPTRRCQLLVFIMKKLATSCTIEYFKFGGVYSPYRNVNYPQILLKNVSCVEIISRKFKSNVTCWKTNILLFIKYSLNTAYTASVFFKWKYFFHIVMLFITLGYPFW